MTPAERDRNASELWELHQVIANARTRIVGIEDSLGNTTRGTPRTPPQPPLLRFGPTPPRRTTATSYTIGGDRPIRITFDQIHAVNELRGQAMAEARVRGPLDPQEALALWLAATAKAIFAVLAQTQEPPPC